MKNNFLNGNATVGKCLPGVTYNLLNKQRTKKSVSGELILNGKQLMEGYINSNEKPFIWIKKKKYYMTGDNFIIKNGKFFFNGRLKDYVKMSGYRVNLKELSDKIYKNLKIDVYIKPNKEELVLFSINKNKKNKIVNFINKNFEWYEKPKKIKFLNKFPLLSNGKIDQSSLK